MRKEGERKRGAEREWAAACFSFSLSLRRPYARWDVDRRLGLLDEGLGGGCVIKGSALVGGGEGGRGERPLAEVLLARAGAAHVTTVESGHITRASRPSRRQFGRRDRRKRCLVQVPHRIGVPVLECWEACRITWTLADLIVPGLA